MSSLIVQYAVRVLAHVVGLCLAGFAYCLHYLGAVHSDKQLGDVSAISPDDGLFPYHTGHVQGSRLSELPIDIQVIVYRTFLYSSVFQKKIFAPRGGSFQLVITSDSEVYNPFSEYSEYSE